MEQINKIMLVGDINKAFLDKAFIRQHINNINNGGLITDSNCDNYAAMPQAIEALKNNTYDGIAVVISELQTKLNPALKTLRDHSDARIILLAQMYEEPIAIRQMSCSYKDKPLVDDYMICPVDIDNFQSLVLGTEQTKDQKQEASDKPCTRRVQDEPRITSNELSTRIRHLEKLATEDDLTGLKNRRYIIEFTRQIIDYAGNENGRVTLLLFDIDDFKKYNDLYGHVAGDEILKQASNLIKRCCRPHDVVGRIGGDEFAVIFWDDPSLLKTVIEQSKINDRRNVDSDHPSEAMIIAKRFVSELETTSSHIEDQNKAELGPEGTGTLTISGGLASFPRDGKSFQELFEQADKALLEAKRSGKNRIYLVGKPQN